MNIVNLEKMLGNTNIVGWSIGEDLPTKLIKSSCVVTKNKVYLIGGICNSEFTNKVIGADLRATGVVSEWSNAEPFPVTVASAACIKIGKMVYVLGGWDGNKNSKDIYTSELDDSGRLGDWNKTGELPISVSDAKVFTIENTLYLLGGTVTDVNSESESLSSDIYTCVIDEENKLGEWTKCVIGLPTVLTSFNVATTNKRIYIIGGCDKAGPTNAVWYSEIADNKTLTPFVPDKELPIVTESAMMVLTNNRVFIIGGTDDRKNLFTVYTANINQEGLVEEWRECDELPLKASAGNVFVDNTTVYVTGAGDGESTLFALFDGWKERN